MYVKDLTVFVVPSLIDIGTCNWSIFTAQYPVIDSAPARSCKAYPNKEVNGRQVSCNVCRRRRRIWLFYKKLLLLMSGGVIMR